jgi:citrate lyase beta subunit
MNQQNVRPARVRRSYFECPIMVEKKWAKVPEIAADVFMLDMEDSAPPNLKVAARARILDLIKDPSYLGGREFVVRTNNLSTEWGRADLEAVADARAPFVVYPKVRSTDEMREVRRIFDERGAAPEIMLIVETPQAVLQLEAIASCPGVTVLLVGPGDLSMETGIAMFDGSDEFADGFLYARSKVVFVAKAYGLQAADTVLTPDLKDLARMRQAMERSRRSGFTGIMSFYPPHVSMINDVMSPSASEVEWARRVVETYTKGRECGLAAISLDGKFLTVHQFAAATDTLRVADMIGRRAQGH